MEIVAESKYVRMTARKLRLVADLVRDLPLSEALAVLENTSKRAAKPILLTYKQAIANAVNNFSIDEKELSLKEIIIGEGPTLKRWRAGSRGIARPINKRTSHIRIVLEGEEKEKGPKKPKSKKEKK